MLHLSNVRSNEPNARSSLQASAVQDRCSRDLFRSGECSWNRRNIPSLTQKFLLHTRVPSKSFFWYNKTNTNIDLMGEVPEAKTEQNSSPPASEAPKDVQAEMKREIEEKNEGEKATEHANDAMRGVQKAANEKGDKMMDGLEKAMKSLETFFAKLSSRLEQFGSGMLKKVAAMLPNPLLNGFLLDIAKRYRTASCRNESHCKCHSNTPWKRL